MPDYSDIIERVAKAIFDQTFRSPAFFTWEGASIKMKAEYCSRARAAITAMREPPVDRGEIYNQVYRDMIDAALKARAALAGEGGDNS